MLDTNICIYLITKKPVNVLEVLETKRRSDIAISVVTLAELQFGVGNSTQQEKNTVALSEFLAIVDILPFDYNAAKEYGVIKAD